MLKTIQEYDAFEEKNTELSDRNENSLSSEISDCNSIHVFWPELVKNVQKSHLRMNSKLELDFEDE